MSDYTAMYRMLKRAKIDFTILENQFNFTIKLKSCGTEISYTFDHWDGSLQDISVESYLTF